LDDDTNQCAPYHPKDEELFVKIHRLETPKGEQAAATTLDN